MAWVYDDTGTVGADKSITLIDPLEFDRIEVIMELQDILKGMYKRGIPLETIGPGHCKKVLKLLGGELPPEPEEW